MKYLALLRGINVGGNNIIKMVELKTAFEAIGLKNVTTFIQSGNVLFTSSEKNIGKLEAKVEKALSKGFKYKSKVVIVSYDTLKTAVKKAPKGFGADPTKFRYDVIFLKPPLTAKAAIKDIPFKVGVDEKYAGKNVLYFSRLTKKASQSKISKIIQLPIYKEMTIRNWNTTTKLLALMENN